jgi:nicotinate-nucleotide pyrophosphorylase (carboxylating)
MGRSDMALVKDNRVAAAGGLTLDTARAVGETGVDVIAVGELTHSARMLHLGLDLREIVDS